MFLACQFFLRFEDLLLLLLLELLLLLLLSFGRLRDEPKSTHLFVASSRSRSPPNTVLTSLRKMGVVVPGRYPMGRRDVISEARMAAVMIGLLTPPLVMSVLLPPPPLACPGLALPPAFLPFPPFLPLATDLERLLESRVG